MEECHLKDIKILEPFIYLSNIPGKDVRGILLDAFQVWLQISSDKINIIKSIISSLHNASLLIDDIEDNSKMRRGVPVAHSIYGIPNTINCANYVYFIALEQCFQLQNTQAMSVFVTEMLNLHRGQGQDILWREQCTCPTEEMYRKMVIDKTGGLFRLAVGLMQAFSENKTDYTNLLNLLGLYFQIRDDYINISSISYMQTKSFCEDITEGKFSFPIIHSINCQPSDTRLLNILRQHTNDERIKRYAVEYLLSTNSLTYTRNNLKELKVNILNEINRLGGHDALIHLMEKLDGQLDEEEKEFEQQIIGLSNKPLVTTL